MRDSRFSFFSQLEFFESNTHNLDDRRLNPLFSRASSRLARDTTTAPREREREKEKERKKERPVEYYTPKGTTTLLMEREKVLREKKRVLSNHKKKKIQKRDEFRVFLFSKLFFGTHISSSSSGGFFQTVVFCLPCKNLSLKKKNGRQKRPPKHQLLRLSTFLRYPIGRTGVVALSVSFSLSLSFVKGKKKKRKRADDDDADDVSRNDFVVVLLHGCNEN